MKRQVSITFDGLDSDTPLNEKLCAKYTRSFAYYTVKDRLPITLTKVINDLATNKGKIVQTSSNQKETEDDLKLVIGQISKLKNELVTNKAFIKLNSKGSDVNDWNNYLEMEIKKEPNSDPPCWFYSPWLYAECYMYRRLQEVFENSLTLYNYDPFKNFKKDAFYQALPAMKAVAQDIINKIDKNCIAQENLQNVFTNFLKLSLWSNVCDLSFTENKELFKDNFEVSKVNIWDPFLLIDGSSNVFNYLKQSSNKVIDFVTDNTAFEIFCDFCFCDLLCSTSLVSKVRFHVKQIPWFISDVTKKDISWLMKKLIKEGMGNLAERWKNYFDDGIWLIFDEKYWTLPYSFPEMKLVDPKLYCFLSESNLVIFKGDLNNRKLLGDINWNPKEEFEVVLKDFKPTSILSLRTIKSDLICGISLNDHKHLEGSKKWMYIGKYSIIQFYEKN